MSDGLTRREFTAAAIAGAIGARAASAATRPAPAPSQALHDPEAPLRISKALKVGMIAEGETLTEKFAIARDAGFGGVELDAPGPFTTDQALEAKAQTGVEIPGVVLSTHWNKPFNHPDPGVREEAVGALRGALRFCAAVGGSSVLVVPAVVNRSMPYAPAYRLAQQELGRCVPIAQSFGVAIALENVWNNFLLSPIEAARFSDELNAKRQRQDNSDPAPDHPTAPVRWHFDIGNIVNYGWPEQWIETLAGRIHKLDIKDYSRAKRDSEGLWKGFAVEIGEGDAGWDSVRRALASINYSGWATAEVGGGDAKRLADIARRMDQALGLT